MFKKKVVWLIICFLVICTIVNAAQENNLRGDFRDNFYHLVKGNYPSMFFSDSYLDYIVKDGSPILGEVAKVPLQVELSEKRVFVKVNKGEVSEVIETVTEKNLVPIIIGLKGFKFLPPKVKVQVNQAVIWRNERDNLDAYIVGLRGISDLRSDVLSPGDEFNWTFNEPGEYQYVDMIIIGSLGNIIVK